MKCKIFKGTWYDVQEAFNKWAKGKSLTRDVIIHTQVTERVESCESTSPTLMIIVFHPEGKEWDTTEPWPKAIREAVESELKETETTQVIV